MKWYDKLYVGSKANAQKSRIINKVNKYSKMPGIYILALPMNDKNVLDIYPLYILSQKHYKKADIRIVGIGCGYDEAMEVMQRLIIDCYQITGQCKISNMIEKSEFA